MNCYYHPENPAVGTCTVCGHPICEQCKVEMQGRLVCRTDLAAGRANIQPAYSSGAKDPNTAFILELIAGFFGFLGVGYLYAGYTNDGVIRLIGWIVYDIIAAITIALLMAVFIGIICVPIQLAIQIGIPLWSAFALKNRLLAAASPMPSY